MLPLRRVTEALAIISAFLSRHHPVDLNFKTSATNLCGPKSRLATLSQNCGSFIFFHNVLIDRVVLFLWEIHSSSFFLLDLNVILRILFSHSLINFVSRVPVTATLQPWLMTRSHFFTGYFGFKNVTVSPPAAQSLVQESFGVLWSPSHSLCNGSPRCQTQSRRVPSIFPFPLLPSSVFSCSLLYVLVHHSDSCLGSMPIFRSSSPSSLISRAYFTICPQNTTLPVFCKSSVPIWAAPSTFIISYKIAAIVSPCSPTSSQDLFHDSRPRHVECSFHVQASYRYRVVFESRLTHPEFLPLPVAPKQVCDENLKVVARHSPLSCDVELLPAGRFLVRGPSNTTSPSLTLERSPKKP